MEFDIKLLLKLVITTNLFTVSEKILNFLGYGCLKVSHLYYSTSHIFIAIFNEHYITALYITSLHNS